MEKGRLVIKEIEYNQLLVRKVMKNNATSGKIQLPRELIGRTIYIVIPDEGD